VSDLRFAILVGLLVALALMKVGEFLLVRGYWREAREILEIAKNYFELGRAQHSDARSAKSDLGAKVDAATGALTSKIEEVPQKVAQVIQASDSGTLKTLPKPGNPFP
jgi:hypothetical protein